MVDKVKSNQRKSQKLQKTKINKRPPAKKKKKQYAITLGLSQYMEDVIDIMTLNLSSKRQDLQKM